MGNRATRGSVPSPDPRVDAMKTCKTCGLSFPLEGFYRNKRSRDGLGVECKSCRNARSASWRAANPERWQAILGRCREKPEQRERRAAYVSAHSDEYRIISRTQRQVWKAV